jgi:hypothetical protein
MLVSEAEAVLERLEEEEVEMMCWLDERGISYTNSNTLKELNLLKIEWTTKLVQLEDDEEKEDLHEWLTASAG